MTETVRSAPAGAARHGTPKRRRRGLRVGLLVLALVVLALAAVLIWAADR